MKIIQASGFVLLGLLFASLRPAIPQDASAAAAIRVRLNYSGSGTVDESHKIYVALWDSPAFAQRGSNTEPVEVKSWSSKDGAVTFSDVKKMPAYVSAAFDPSGHWEGTSAPPDGSSLGLYSKTPGKPAPIDIAPGKTASVEISFDDTVKMRSGKASGPAH